MDNIKNLNKDELYSLLKALKIYRNLIKKIWNRWKNIFKQIYFWKNTFFVEYYWDLDKQYVLDNSKKVYKNIFNFDVLDNDIIIKENKNLKWWMKVYLNDNLVDMSFQKFYNLLK
jgi:hypothetical protein